MEENRIMNQQREDPVCEYCGESKCPVDHGKEDPVCAPKDQLTEDDLEFLVDFMGWVREKKNLYKRPDDSMSATVNWLTDFFSTAEGREAVMDRVEERYGITNNKIPGGVVGREIKLYKGDSYISCGVAPARFLALVKALRKAEGRE